MITCLLDYVSRYHHQIYAKLSRKKFHSLKIIRNCFLKNCVVSMMLFREMNQMNTFNWIFTTPFFKFKRFKWSNQCHEHQEWHELPDRSQKHLRAVSLLLKRMNLVVRWLINVEQTIGLGLAVSRTLTLRWTKYRARGGDGGARLSHFLSFC